MGVFRLHYNYAVIDVNSGRCFQVMRTQREFADNDCICIPSCDENYLEKYYNQSNGLWYVDSEFSELYDDGHPFVSG